MISRSSELNHINENDKPDSINPQPNQSEKTVKDKLIELESAIESLKSRDVERVRKQELLELVNALTQLKQILKTHYDSYLSDKDSDHFSKMKSITFAKFIYQADFVLNEVLILLHGLNFGLNETESDLNKILNFINHCHEALQPEKNSRSVNFLKAVTSVAITAVNMVIGTLAGAILGLGSVAFTAITCGLMGAHYPSNKVAKVAGAVLGSCLGLLVSPIPFSIMIFAGAYLGGATGYMIGKDLTKIPAHESVARYLMFKQPSLPSAVADVAETAKKFVVPKADRFSNFFNHFFSRTTQAKPKDCDIKVKEMVTFSA